MAPEDPEAKDVPDDAFAATVAPASSVPPQRARAVLESDQTLVAPVVGALPMLPTVPRDHYANNREIARGGMGAISAADDQRLRRPVAIKELIDPVPEQIGRFQREALITARLQHPGIVPIYEAGAWPSGKPFFAMKLVSGRPLDQVIGGLRTLAQRLAQLPRIAAAADAMAYAHSQRVIHRDLKPANVLVGDFGETVVIDWGLAKDLDATDGLESAERVPMMSERIKKLAPLETDATLTVAGAVMGTPAYMAPEQARGEPLDERADVFALGAMLYHLLAGVPPYNARTATDVIAAAMVGKVVPLEEREPQAPADLVAIVHRAMAQEPRDRYANAGEVAAELERFMTGQLVQSHRYTALQRVTRFVRKHRGAVTIATISLVAFAVLGTLAIRQIVEQRDAATEARGIAERRRLAAEKLIDRMLTDVKDRLQQIGRLDVLSNMGGEIRDYYATLATIPGGMHEADGERMAKAVDIVGLAERDSGKLVDALATWRSARDELAVAIGTDASPRTLFKRTMLARFDYQIGTVHQQRGKISDAIGAFTAAEKTYAALLAQAPRDRDVLRGAADTHDKLGDLLRNEGKIAAAFEEYLAAKSEREGSANTGGSTPDDVIGLSTSHLKLGSIYIARGESAAAQAEFQAALHLRETLLETEPDNVEYLKRVIDAQSELADMQKQVGDDASGIRTLRDMMTTSAALVRRDPTNFVWKRDRGNLLADLGFALLETGAFADAVAELEAAIAMQQELVAKDDKVQSWQGDLARSYLRAGDVLIAAGDLSKGIASYRLSHDLRARLVTSDPKSAPYRRSLAWADAKLGNALAQKGELPAALAAHERALAARTTLVAEAPNHIGFTNELASTEITLGRMLVTKDRARARTLIESGMTRARALVDGDNVNYEWKETLIQGLLARADLARAANDRAARSAALVEARAIATDATTHAPMNTQWPGYAAEIHAALADLDPASAEAEWALVRDALEPLAKERRLPAPRRALLDRARNPAR